MNRSMPGLPVHHQLPEFTQTHVHQVRDAIQPSHPLSSPFPPAPNPSKHQSLYQWVILCMRWPKYWSFSFSIIPSKEIPGLISFRMDWFSLFRLSFFHYSFSSVPLYYLIYSLFLLVCVCFVLFLTWVILFFSSFGFFIYSNSLLTFSLCLCILQPFLLNIFWSLPCNLYWEIAYLYFN